jgi:hypothetical protein
MAMLAAAEKFLAKHLGGRYQESMTEAVAKRLGEITVDPKSVVLEKSAKESTEAPAADLSGKWIITLDAGGQQILIETEIKQENGSLTGSLLSMFGGGSIKQGVIRGTLVSMNAIIEAQGQQVPLLIEGKLDGANMSGTISGGGMPTLPFTAARAK